MKKFGSLVICMALLLCACKKPDTDTTISESSASEETTTTAEETEETTEETEEENLYPYMTYEEISVIEGTMFEANCYNTENTNEYVDYLDTISCVVNYDGTLVIHFSYNLSPDFVEFFTLTEEELMTIYELGHDGYYLNLFEDADMSAADDSSWDFSFYDETTLERHLIYEGGIIEDSRFEDFISVVEPYLDQVMEDLSSDPVEEPTVYDENITISWDSRTPDFGAQCSVNSNFSVERGAAFTAYLTCDADQDKEVTCTVMSFDGEAVVVTFSIPVTDSSGRAADTYRIPVGEETTFTYEDETMVASCRILVE